MTDWCIVVADGARARLFTATLADGAATSATLVEKEDLVEPEATLADREIYTDKAGLNKPGAGYEDHRGRHREEVERRFAKRIATAVGHLLQAEHSEALVVVAAPRLLGVLRGALDSAISAGPPRIEVSADLTWQALPRLQHALAQLGVLPDRAPYQIPKPPAPHKPSRRRRDTAS